MIELHGCWFISTTCVLDRLSSIVILQNLVHIAVDDIKTLMRKKLM